MSFTVVALYKFTKLVDPKDIKQQIDVICLTYNILGALIMAHEGKNISIHDIDYS
jgi:predicted sulfurtransferase